MSQSTSAQTILIVGASRGLGLGLAREYSSRGWRVIGTERSRSAELHALSEASGGLVEIETVDIVEPAQVAGLRERLEGRSLDVLFVNAGVANGSGETLPGSSTAEFIRVLVTNALSPMRVVESFGPLVVQGGVIAVMSSGLGSVGNNTAGGWEVYRASKASLNTLMRSYAVRAADETHTLLIMAPGWVRTDMGGAAASLDVGTSTRGMADVIERRTGTPGVAYVDYLGKTVPW